MNDIEIKIANTTALIKTRRQLFKYIQSNFPDNYIVIQAEIKSSSNKEDEFSAYMTIIKILGDYNWSPTFSKLKDLIKYVVEKVERYKLSQ